MTDVYDSIDFLRVYHSGASSEDSPQEDPTLSIGGYKSSSVLAPMKWVRVNPIHSIRIDYVSSNVVGIGTLDATSNEVGGEIIYKLRWNPPGDDAGAYTQIDSGETVRLESDSTSADYIIVTRINSQPINGSESVHVMNVYNNVIAQSDRTIWDGLYGPLYYRSIFLKNVSSSSRSFTATYSGGDTHITHEVATETPVDGAIQEISAETSSPTGLSFGASAAITLAAGESVGLWMRLGRDAAVISPHEQITLQCAATSPTSTLKFSGLTRFYDTSQVAYMTYASLGTSPDPDVDPAILATTDMSASISIAFTDGTWYLQTYSRNKYGLLSPLLEEKYLVVSGTNVYDRPPNVPENIELANVSNGKFSINASYYPFQEGCDATSINNLRATRWLIYYTYDGTEPSATGAADGTVAMDATVSKQFLNWTSPTAFAEDTVIKVKLKTYRTGDSRASEASSTYTTTITRTSSLWLSPNISAGKKHGLVLGRTAGPEDSTTYVSTDPLVYFVTSETYTQLWAETILIYQCHYPSGEDADGVIYMSSDWDLITFPVTGDSTNDPVDPIEIGTWISTSKKFYICVNGIRKVIVDVTNKQLKSISFTLPGTMPNIYPQEVAWPRVSDTLLQVWDKDIYMFIPSIQVTSAGAFVTRLNVDQTHTQAEILAL